MKRMKKVLVGCALLVALAATSITALAAASYQTPAEAAAALTGKTEAQIQAERQSGKGYGTIAAEAGKLEEFQQAVREICIDALGARVASGTMTQAQADAAIAAMQERQAACDGTGVCNGTGGGNGAGGGNGRGQGRGGRGMGLRDGSCL